VFSSAFDMSIPDVIFNGINAQITFSIYRRKFDCISMPPEIIKIWLMCPLTQWLHMNGGCTTPVVPWQKKRLLCTSPDESDLYRTLASVCIK